MQFQKWTVSLLDKLEFVPCVKSLIEVRLGQSADSRPKVGLHFAVVYYKNKEK